jgi:hypothetical protein
MLWAGGALTVGAAFAEPLKAAAAEGAVLLDQHVLLVSQV